MGEPLFGGSESDPNTVSNDHDERHYDRARNMAQPKPKALCTNCLQDIEWSRVDSAWWKFNPGTTERHTCKTS